MKVSGQLHATEVVSLKKHRPVSIRWG